MDVDELFSSPESFKRDFPRFVWALGQLDLIDFMQLQKIQKILLENLGAGKELDLDGIC